MAFNSCSDCAPSVGSEAQQVRRGGFAAVAAADDTFCPYEVWRRELFAEHSHDVIRCERCERKLHADQYPGGVLESYYWHLANPGGAPRGKTEWTCKLCRAETWQIRMEIEAMQGVRQPETTILGRWYPVPGKMWPKGEREPSKALPGEEATRPAAPWPEAVPPCRWRSTGELPTGFGIALQSDLTDALAGELASTGGPKSV